MILKDINIDDDKVVESHPGSSSLNNLCIWGLGLLTLKVPRMVRCNSAT
jgi:hypothetical protein